MYHVIDNYYLNDHRENEAVCHPDQDPYHSINCISIKLIQKF